MVTRVNLGMGAAAFLIVLTVVAAAPSADAAAIDCQGRRATIVGTPGDDILGGTAGDDVIHGLGGNDLIFGKTGDDVLCGGAGRDRIDGGKGADQLAGGTGRDVLIGGFGPDSIDGGSGIDWVSFIYRGELGMMASLVSNTARPYVAGNAELRPLDVDKLEAIENIIGTNGADMLVGNDGPNVIRGAGGDDEIIPLRMADDIDGGAGFDWVEYFPNNRRVIVDLKRGVARGSGRDTITRIEAVWGTDFADTLAGDGADNYLFGGEGDDKLFGKVGVDRLEPGAGDDTLNGGFGEDWAYYPFEDAPVAVDIAAGTAIGAGRDTLIDVESALGTDFSDSLFGDAGSNYLIGGPGDDDLRGRGGPDNLDPGSGNDEVRGGFDSDWVYYWTSATPVSIDLDAGTAAGSGTDSLVSIENAVGTDHDDTIFGSAVSNSLWGFGGNDTLRGRAGDDFLQAAGGGTNTLIGGPGHDVIRFNLWDSPVVFDLRTSTSTVNGIDNLFGIEGAWGTVHDDSLTGDDAANTLLGLEGDDTLVGLAGNDLLDGGPGTDDLAGGGGDDTCIAGETTSNCEQFQLPASLDAVGSPSPAARTPADGLRRIRTVELLRDLLRPS